MKNLLLALAVLFVSCSYNEEPVFPNCPHFAKIVDGDVLSLRIISDLESVQVKIGDRDWGTIKKQFYRCSSYRGFTGGTILFQAEELTKIEL